MNYSLQCLHFSSHIVLMAALEEGILISIFEDGVNRNPLDYSVSMSWSQEINSSFVAQSPQPP